MSTHNRRTRYYAQFGVLAAALFAGASAATAATLTVNSTADDGNGTCTATKCTLRDAVVSAAAADRIVFSLPANSTISLTNGSVSIDKVLTVNGPGANLLTIQRSTAAGTAQFRIFDVSGNSTVVITGMTLTNGSPAGIGGAILNNGFNLTLTDCTILHNVANAADGGGGIYNNTKLTVNNCTIADNTAAFGGGGIYSTNDLTINNSTISGNSTSSLGGGIKTSGTLTINNSTISGNSVTSGSGGGVFAGNGATITNSTISGNMATGTYFNVSGGGGMQFQGTMTLRNTIVARNTGSPGPDIDNLGTITSQGYNLIGDGSAAKMTATTGDQIGTAAAPIDPMLGSLQNNGGPTKTHALLAGSKAIDMGDSGGNQVDQRGFTRPVDTPSITNVGDGSDIGAYEVQPDQLVGCSELNLTVNNTNDGGGGSLRFVLASACGGSTVDFAPAVRGAINLTSGELPITKNVFINGPGANLLAVQRSSAQGTSNFRIFNIATKVRASISGLTVANGNTPNGHGAGILNAGTLTLDRTTISGNTASLSGNGAGIFNDFGTLTITNSTLSGNSVSSNIGAGSGGGIFNSGGTISITNSTISGNTAIGPSNGDDSGGGILTNVGTVGIYDSTIVGNSADFGGGIRSINGASVYLENTILALNTSPNGPDGNGSNFISSGAMLVGNNATMSISGGAYDQIGTPSAMIDPRLGPLQDNGGPIFTRALLPGSPAIDKGLGIDALTTDQRGFPRRSDDPGISNVPTGDGTDIGAFELQYVAPPTPAPTPTPTATPTPTSATLGNISTRLSVQNGDNVLIAGLIVTGDAGATKKVMIRGLGPSLAQAGVPNPIAEPLLELHGPSGFTTIVNDNWADASNTSEIPNGFQPSDPRESVIIATLTLGPQGFANYTAILRGANGETGVGLVEAYDLETGTNQFANISTRGFIDNGDNVMIGGFILGGSSQGSKVLIRAIGPSLSNQGVSGALADPILELHDSQGAKIRSNDNWKIDDATGQSQEAAITATTIPPSNDLESAVLDTFPPGAYTAIVSGKSGGTGVGLVEVYNLR